MRTKVKAELTKLLEEAHKRLRQVETERSDDWDTSTYLRIKNTREELERAKTLIERATIFETETLEEVGEVEQLLAKYRPIGQNPKP